MAYRITTEKSWSATYRELEACFRSWGIAEWSVEANVPLARTSSWSLTEVERAVTVVYVKDGRQVTLSLDTQRRPVDNLRALYLCLDAMRLIEARGLGDTAQSAYLQLAAPVTARDPHEVLGLRPGAGRDEIEAMFRVRAKRAHPDAGGSEEAMAELNAARDALLAQAVA